MVSRNQQIGNYDPLPLAYLRKIHPPEEYEEIFILPNCRLSVGRDVENEISIPNERSSSRFHCVFISDNENVYIYERSGHGTFVNGERINQTRKITGDDKIQIGQTVFHFVKSVKSK